MSPENSPRPQRKFSTKCAYLFAAIDKRKVELPRYCRVLPEHLEAIFLWLVVFVSPARTLDRALEEFT